MLSGTNLPESLYNAAQCRELDRLAIEDHGIPGIALMKRAGGAAYELLLARWPRPELITVFCGAGNNGGDGYIVAALAAQQNVPTRVIQLGDPAKLKGDAAKACEFARQARVEMLPFSTELIFDKGVLVDALLGIGARGAPRGDFARAIAAMNASGLPVLAIDIPSGLDADTGHVHGESVRADATATFVGLKQGLFTGRAPARAGELFFSALGIPDSLFRQIPSSVKRVTMQLPRKCLPPRAADAHKGNFGHVLVVGGDLGTGGAALMAAEAAARTGAGLISVATRAEHCASFLARRPELMVRGVDSAASLEPLLARASVVVVGPGMGQSDWAKLLFKAVLASGLPLVVDADGLNLISQDPETFGGQREWVLTPHPGEAARLLNCSTADIQSDRFAAASSLQARFGGAVLLKGAGTVIAGSPPILAVTDTGNPGMASGGMGDILSGVLAGMLAQGLGLADAALVSALLHGKAADLAAFEAGERGLLATDLLPYLRRLVNPRD